MHRFKSYSTDRFGNFILLFFNKKENLISKILKIEAE